jgi:hypothetical protein
MASDYLFGIFITACDYLFGIFITASDYLFGIFITASDYLFGIFIKYHTVGTILKSNIDTLNIQIHDCSLSWFGTGTSVKSSVINLSITLIGRMHIGVDLLLRGEKHLHVHVISLRGEVLVHKISLITLLFIEVPVPNQESDILYKFINFISSIFMYKYIYDKIHQILKKKTV